MSELKEGISAICSALVVLGVLRLLIPKGRLDRTVEISFGVATVLAIIIPLASGIGLKPNETTDVNKCDELAFSELVSDQIMDNSSSQVETIIINLLRQANIESTEISVDMDISDQGGIFIKYVRIKGVPADSAMYAQQHIAYNLGLEMQDVEVTDG